MKPRLAVVFLKEIRDALRDRRTALMILVASVLAGPVTLILVASFVSGMSRAGNRAALEQLKDRLIKGAHAQLSGTLNRAAKPLDLPFLDQLGHIVRLQHHLNRRNLVLVSAGDESLRHHGLEIECQIHTQLAMRLFREKIQDALHRLAGIVGMQCGEA